MSPKHLCRQCAETNAGGLVYCETCAAINTAEEMLEGLEINPENIRTSDDFMDAVFKIASSVVPKVTP